MDPAQGDMTPEQREAALDEFLDASATTLSGLAWKGFQEHGRGVLVVIYDKASIQFVPAETFKVRFLEVTGVPDHPFLGLVDTYEPTTVFAIMFSASFWQGSVCQTIQPVVPPPLAATATATYVVKDRVPRGRPRRKEGGK